MEIKLHNTLGNQKEEFKSIKSKAVHMYNCGPTVYSFAHIGNMRAYVFADIFAQEVFKKLISPKQEKKPSNIKG